MFTFDHPKEQKNTKILPETLVVSLVGKDGKLTPSEFNL